MSTVTEEEAEEPDVEPACETSLLNGEWEGVEAAVYPPGYPRLCTAEECFGGEVPPEAWHEDDTAEWDHMEHVDTLIRSSESGHSRRYHKPRDEQ